MSLIKETHTGGVIAINLSPGGRYGIVPRALLEDKNLGLDTRCAAAWLSSQAEGFQVSVSALCHLVGVTKDRWQRMARELEKGGYLARAKHPSGKRGRWVWEITFSAMPMLTVAVFTGDGRTGAGGTVAGQASDIRIQEKEHKHKKTTTHNTDPRACVSNSLSDSIQTQKSKDKGVCQGSAMGPDLEALVEANFQAAMATGGIKLPGAYRHRLERLAVAGELKPPTTVTGGGRRGGKKTVDEVIADLMEKGGAE